MNKQPATLNPSSSEPPAPICQIKDKEVALRFVLAGNSYFTIRSLKTQTRYTYKVSLSDDGNVYFVSVLWGSSNETDYRYLGVISKQSGGWVFRTTRKSAGQLSAGNPQAVAFDYMLRHLEHPRGSIPEQMEFWHEGRCGRCGRKLTVPESIESGIGPECAKKGLEHAQARN
jgi:hypothetical protein